MDRGKRRRAGDDFDNADKRPKTEGHHDQGSTWKPSARFKHVEGGRDWTVSVAIPSSVIKDIPAADMQAMVPGRIGRALAVFSVDEVVIYDDSPLDDRNTNVDKSGYTGDTDPGHFMSYLLTYLETPPFMRKAMFPFHKNLRFAGKLPSLDMPHHPNPRDWLGYLEGIALKKEGEDRKKKGTPVDVGSGDPVWVEDEVPANTRITLKFDSPESTTPTPVHPHAPRTEAGYYWGYSVRQADSLSTVFTESPFEGGYDVSIGTSERGLTLDRAFAGSRKLSFKHLLVVFGGPRGIEYAAVNDEELGKMMESGTKAREMFDYWVNVLPGQGSRTIRTDEALYITMALLGREMPSG